jgi:hypothetical protein
LSGDVTGSVSFDGSSNTNIVAVVADDSHNHIVSNIDGLSLLLDNKTARVSVSTDNAVVRFDGASGEIQNSSVTVNNSGEINFHDFSTGEDGTYIMPESQLAKINLKWISTSSKFTFIRKGKYVSVIGGARALNNCVAFHKYLTTSLIIPTEFRPPANVDIPVMALNLASDSLGHLRFYSSGNMEFTPGGSWNGGKWISFYITYIVL